MKPPIFRRALYEMPPKTAVSFETGCFMRPAIFRGGISLRFKIKIYFIYRVLKIEYIIFSAVQLKTI